MGSLPTANHRGSICLNKMLTRAAGVVNKVGKHWAK